MTSAEGSKKFHYNILAPLHSTCWMNTFEGSKWSEVGPYSFFISRPGQSQGLLYEHLCHSFIEWVSEPFPPTALRRRHAQMMRDSSSSYKIDCFIVIKTILNPVGHQNCISGLKVRTILLKGWILHIGEASAVEGLRSTGLPRLVFLMYTYKHGLALWRFHKFLARQVHV